jgi:hypothetical protein
MPERKIMAPIHPNAFEAPEKLSTDELVLALNRMPLSPVNFGCTPIQAAGLTREAARRLRAADAENAKLREAGLKLLKACPHEAEGAQRALAALEMKQALGIE